MASISAHAAAHYEALRRQLLSSEVPSAHAEGVGILVRRGLAAWAERRCETASPLAAPFPSSVSTASSEHDAARSSLVKLIANLILNPWKETLSCQT